MRDILFRGKCKYRDGFVYGSHVVFPESKTQKILVWNRADLDFDAIVVIPETVGQYTGLTDRNGKKIFEGDICDLNILVNDHELVEISIKHGCVGFEPLDYDSVHEDGKKWKSFWISDEDEMWDPKYFSVIGNIHDNPELLEAKV